MMSQLANGQIGSRGLADLHNVVLSGPARAMVDKALSRSGGPRPWIGRKEREIRDIKALEHLAPPGRLQIAAIDALHSLRVLMRLNCPVACRAEAGGEQVRVVVQQGVELGLTYPQAVLSEALPGYAFFEVLSPRRVFHPNVAPEPEHVQRLCLGTTLPARIRCVDLVLLAYDALRMQEIQADEYDAAGVLNLDAARYWQVNREQLPLSRAAFLEV